VTRKRPPSPSLKKAANRRASPEAVEKRRAARLFNQVLLRDRVGAAPDGRTERRRRRLLNELSRGASRGGKRGLKPIDVLARVQELLALGEPVASIRKACPRPRPVEATPEIVEGIRRIHLAYDFPVEVYAFVGLDQDALRRAGVLPTTGASARPGLRSTRPRRRLTRVAARS
jgi:hypothetical protein